MRMRVLGEKLRVENENKSSEGENEIEIENETPNFQEIGWKVQLLWLFTLKSLSLKHQDCSEMVEKLPLKSTKLNLDVSNFWELENESWEWEWEFWGGKMRLKLRMRLPIFKNGGLIKT